MKGVGNSINISAIISENSTLNRVFVDEGTRVCEYTNLYGCKIGKKCLVATFVEIQDSVVIGDGTRIQSHTFICSGVEIGSDCFISHHNCFINDDFKNHKVNFNKEDWKKTKVGNGVTIGSGCTIFPITIADGAILGAGSVATHDIGENEIWYGSPAKFIKIKS